MSVKIVVPQLGNEISEAEVTEWLKVVGDTVKAGDEIVTITTTKTAIEIEATVSGTLTEIMVPEGELVEVGAVLGLITE
ncbi:biotin/lipoyl-containing protein [Parasulfitobacter algicola]|uniref:Biotin-binding protein n=1 Tax=Parasulfitobacter algicola TaxID=2614809 RepID=A0ABX2IVV7_9RHOB|nr:biotin/lipoyl-containing protein [Sulfitobacter algicola]NSX56640.1 biotin-binding protein [Sulfitobacter algicola]